MAVQWSSEDVIAKHPSIGATAMGLDRTGSYALLAAKRTMFLIDLDQPQEIVKKLSRMQQKYEVSNIEWNPTHQFASKFVISAGETADIFSWQQSSFTLENTLVGHTRSITDLNWHRTEPHLLTTCSIDTFIHFWDTRENRKPVQSVSAVAGASQIKWNKMNPHLLASGHEGCMRIWDRRKTSQALFYISAHLYKIYCVDWSPTQEEWIASCSNDQTVRFFNLKDRDSEPVIETNNSVWRARYTPDGESVVTEVVPPLRRAENLLQLWSIHERKAPRHTFYGHSDVVLEYEWRNHRDSTSRDELVTWSRDRTLRIWKVHPQWLKCSSLDFEDDGSMIYQTEVSSNEGMITGNFSPIGLPSAITDTTGIPLSPEREDTSCNSMNGHKSDCDTDNNIATTPESHVDTPDIMYNLQEEFDAISAMLQSFRLDHVEISCKVETRTCVVTTRIGSTNAVLTITLPAKYPRSAPPSFHLGKRTNFDTSFKLDLIRKLKGQAAAILPTRKPSLENCIRTFIYHFKQINKIEEKLYMEAMNATGAPNQKYGGQLDYNIPFPRTSGARFCGSGQLVCFMRPTAASKQPRARETTLPRSLSALGANISSLLPKTPSNVTSPQHPHIYPPELSESSEKISISMYYYNGTVKVSKKESAQQKKAGLVLVYDATDLSPISRDMGMSYIFNEYDLVGSCLHNKEVAMSFDRADLVEVWTMAASVAETHMHNCKNEDYVIISNPLGRRIIVSYIEKYLQIHDVQTAAMLSCIFGEKPTVPQPPKTKSKPFPETHYRTLHEGQKETQSLLSKIRHYSVLESSKSNQYDEIRRAYCNILYKWDLIEQRVAISNYIKVMSSPIPEIDFTIRCYNCNQTTNHPQCRYCKKFSFKCAICNIPVKGSSNCCPRCGHGGHTGHFIEWFSQFDQCPAGCGCHCIEEVDKLFDLEF